MKLHDKRHRHMLAVLSIGCLALAAACSSAKSSHSASSTGSAAGAASTATIRVAYATGTQANFYYAMQHNMFAANGVKVQGTAFSSGPALIAALAAGSADVGYFGPPALINADVKGSSLQVFGFSNDTGDMDALYVNPSSGIKSIADLAGKTVATGQSTVPDIMLHIALKQAGVPFSKVNVKYVDVASLVPAYQRGDVPAVWMFNSVGAKLLSAGAQLVKSSTDLGLSDPGDFVAKKSYIASHKDALQRFLKTVDKATAITNADAKATESALMTGAGLTQQQAQVVATKELKSGVLNSTLTDKKNRLSLVPGGGFEHLMSTEAQMMKQMGMISAVPDVTTMFTASVVTGLK